MSRPSTSLALIAVCAIIALPTPAKAELVSNAPITVPVNNIYVSVEFISHTALYEGNLYFLGSGTAASVLAPAPNSDAAGLGQFLFNNHLAAPGDQTQLLGIFNAGDVLHFAYDIVHPLDVAPELFRTDVHDDKKYFEINFESWIVGIEDLRKPGSDLDYDDIVFRILFTPVPAPGALAMLAVAGVVGRRGRRRR